MDSLAQRAPEELEEAEGLLQYAEAASTPMPDEETCQLSNKNEEPKLFAVSLLDNDIEQQHNVDLPFEAEQRPSVDSKSSKRPRKSQKKRDKLFENLRITQRTLNFDPSESNDLVTNAEEPLPWQATPE